MIDLDARGRTDVAWCSFGSHLLNVNREMEAPRADRSEATSPRVAISAAFGGGNALVSMLCSLQAITIEITCLAGS